MMVRSLISWRESVVCKGREQRRPHITTQKVRHDIVHVGACMHACMCSAVRHQKRPQITTTRICLHNMHAQVTVPHQLIDNCSSAGEPTRKADTRAFRPGPPQREDEGAEPESGRCNFRARTPGCGSLGSHCRGGHRLARGPHCLRGFIRAQL